jgi:hypothetical protein
MPELRTRSARGQSYREGIRRDREAGRIARPEKRIQPLICLLLDVRSGLSVMIVTSNLGISLVAQRRGER